MAKSCNLKFSLDNAKAFTELKKYCGNNDTQFFNYLAKDQQLFKKFYEELQETIITYIEHNFSEAKTYCILNDMHSGII